MPDIRINQGSIIQVTRSTKYIQIHSPLRGGGNFGSSKMEQRWKGGTITLTYRRGRRGVLVGRRKSLSAAPGGPHPPKAPTKPKRQAPAKIVDKIRSKIPRAVRPHRHGSLQHLPDSLPERSDAACRGHWPNRGSLLELLEDPPPSIQHPEALVAELRDFPRRMVDHLHCRFPRASPAKTKTRVRVSTRLIIETFEGTHSIYIKWIGLGPKGTTSAFFCILWTTAKTKSKQI